MFLQKQIVAVESVLIVCVIGWPSSRKPVTMGLLEVWERKAAADAFTSTEETTVGIYILKSQDRSEDFWIVLEGQKVLQGLDNFALAMAMLFGLMYALNLNYPPEMKHTFEVLQKIVMELEGCALSKKAQVLRNRLYE
ncbi:cAMP-dependent protein kinase regulatory subunit [Labeo rohita]|uniref:cAMP-dependent protein kinase regulatory subunit n=1 Tax=Labeo rohita TaxID=84645 RepID=A0ABQ8LBV3_LABRO|nr:cAMP-dependent protein kinase regulatory subunit [Labeo rohita]